MASPAGLGRGRKVLGRDLGVKFQRGSRSPASVILSSGHQTGHFVCNTLRGREISVKIKRLHRGKNHKNGISSDKLPSGMEKTVFGVVCWEEGTFLSVTEALPFDVQIPRLQHVLWSRTHVPRPSRPLSLPWGMRAGAGFKSEHQSSLPDFKGPGKMPLQCLHLLTCTLMHQPGFNPQGGFEWTSHVHLL